MGWMEMIAILRKIYTMFRDLVSVLKSLLYAAMAVSFLGHVTITGLSKFLSYWCVLSGSLSKRTGNPSANLLSMLQCLLS